MRKIAILLLAISIVIAESSPRAYSVPRPLDELISEREASASSPSVALLIPELAALWDHEDPEAVLAAVTAATEDRRTPPWVTGYMRWAQANLLMRLGRIDEARQISQELGFIQQWVLVGPFDNENEAGFERELPPEAAIGQALDLEASYEGSLRPVSWRDYPSEVHLDGLTAIGDVLEPATDSCALLATVVESRRPARAALRFGQSGAIKIWVNGTEVFSDDGDRSVAPDRNAVGVSLRRGRNRVIVKSCNTSGAWDVYFRLTQPDGRPLSGVTISTDHEDIAAAPPRGSEPFEVPSLWAYFWDRVGGEPSDDASEESEEGEGEVEAEEGEEEEEEIPARHWFELARFLLLFGGDDPSEHRARDAAEAAVDAEETIEHLRLFVRIHPDRNERLAALRRAEALDNRDLDVLMALAGEMTNGPHPEDAAHYLDRAEQIAPNNLYVALARADMLDSFGMTQTAISQVRALAESAPRARVFSVLRGLADNADNAELEQQMMERYFETHQSSGSLRVVLARYYANHDQSERALELLREGLAYSPSSTALRRELSMVLESTGAFEESLALRRESIEIRPDDGRLHESLARYLDRRGEDAEAQRAARRSLELRPENPWLRQWLSVVSREERFEEPYVEEAEQFLARRGGERGHDVRTLLDLEVRKVHQSGQSDEFRQIVFEAVTLEGARALSRYQVAFTPHRQRLSVERARVHRPDGSTREAVGRQTRNVYDPSVRMYYDLRATTISFGDVQPGDVVEIRYRISEVGDSNELGDYFGEMKILQSFTPRARFSYVLLAPADRELHFNEPEMPALQHRVNQRGDEVEHIFEAIDVPPIAREQGMPPLAEVAPVLHVSTFQSWEELGEWYWNLVRDQLELDASQRATAEELTEGLQGDEAMVRAIHRHVVQSVRYVALEFGVHRFKPYRVSDIERRGFGDCKDQASLMIAMLRHVGVDAEIVLLRTRHLGRIEPSPPSLQVFNHAIVYVPSLQLYIDPTAERVAVGDLPSGDQGVMVLRVAEGRSTLETTPLLEPQRQSRHLNLELTLDATGTARGELAMETHGWIAGMSRAALDDPANRVNYLERLLSRYLRGARVSNVATSDLSELDSDSEVTMDLEVPNFARQEGGGLSFAVSVAPRLSSVVSLPTREQDLVFGPPAGWVESIDLRIPAGMRVVSLPQPVEIESPVATFRIAVTQAGNGPIQLRSTLLWRAERVSPEQYQQLREFVEQVTAARTARVRLVAQ